MISIILVDKHGVEKEKQIKSALFSLDAVYKYAGFRKGDGFAHRHSWKMNDGTYISCYGKIEGMANNENKYELPPPIDNALFFGSLVLIHTKQTLKNVENTGNIKELLMDMSVKQYKEYYDELFGGFDDIETDSNDEGDGDGDDDELENVDPKMLTKEGYLKDDFIVDSEEEGGDDGDGDYSLECETKTKTKTKIKTKPKRIVKGTSKKTCEDTNKTISTKPSILKNVGKSKLIQSETLKKEVHKNKQSKLSKALDSHYESECEGDSENTIDDEYYDSELEEETYIQE